jgi:hypothetical protein
MQSWEPPVTAPPVTYEASLAGNLQKSLIIAVAVSVAVRDPKEEPPEPGRPL